MPRFIFTAILLFLTVVPATFSSASFSSASEGTARPFAYNDNRLGEHKDESDRFKFARIQFGPLPMPGEYLGDHGPAWSHDYPEAGQHLIKILSELSKLEVYPEEEEYIFSFADPNLFKYPLAYLCEVGHMDLSDEEVAGMREYLLRGGFLLVDDFRAWDMDNFQYYLKRALPEYEVKPLEVSHPIFNCFFSIKSLDVRAPYGRLKPEFLGIEDKNGRLMMIINYNNDVSDYWQWSNDPFQPIEDTNSAYKFGVNYVFYALTH